MVISLFAAGGALLGGAIAGYGQARPRPGYQDVGGGYMVRETGAYGVQAQLPTGVGRGTLGGTVIARGRQMLMIQTPDGRRILIKTQKRRRAPQRRAAGTKMEKLLELAVISSMFKK